MKNGALESQPIVGLFGTCGESTFRQDVFIPEFEKQGIDYFNPQVVDWKPELAEIESDHLSHDVVQCWPVTGETYGTGSLAEQGYSIASSLRAPTPLPKFVIPMIEMELSPSLTDEVAAKASVRARKLALTHLKNNASPNVFLVESLNEMLEASIILYGVAAALVELGRTKNPAFKQFIEARNNALAFRQALESGKLGKDAASLTARTR